MSRKRIAILGSTGSIGIQALDIVRTYPDKFSVEVLTAGNNTDLLIRQAREFDPHIVVIANEDHYEDVASALTDADIKVFSGRKSVAQVVEFGDVDIHGFVSQGYLQSDENNFIMAQTKEGTFEFNELGINFTTMLLPHLRAGVQLFAKDLGVIGNDQVEIDWAYGDYRWKDWAGIRVGILKIPHGLYSETRDIDALRTCILLPQSVYSNWAIRLNRYSH